jgi:hypothetical protein
MNVKAFIDEATEAALKIDQANRQVESAKEGVEAARAALEASRAAVDTAKQGVTAAKEEFDSFAERAEQYGLTRSKFKDVVERMKSVLADIGAIELAATEPTEPVEQKPKAARKRKGEVTTETAQTEQAGEQAPATDVADQSTTIPSGDAMVTTVEELASHLAATGVEVRIRDVATLGTPEALEAPEVAEQPATAVETTAETLVDDEILPEIADRIANNPLVMKALAALDTDETAGDEVLIVNLTDPVTIASAKAAADAGYGEWPSPMEALAAEDQPGEPAAATIEIEEIANILRSGPEPVVVAESKDDEVIAEVAKVIEAHTTTSTAETLEEVDEELDNSVAEQELLDFVDEVGTSDNDVKAVLIAAVKVVSWHTTNIAKTILRTQPSPLTLPAVLVVEDAEYAPKDIKEAYAVAVSFGGEKLAAAISWFNKSLDLLADAKPVEDFRFSEPVKAPRAKKEEASSPAAAAVAPETPAPTVAETVKTPSDAELDEVIDATDAASEVSETIEDMQLFAEAEEADGPTEIETPVPPKEEKVVPVPPRVSKPSWLK